MRFSSSAGALRDQRVLGTTPNMAPPSHQYAVSRIRVISKSPSVWDRPPGLSSSPISRASALDQFAAAVEEIGGIVHQFAPAFKHVAADFRNVVAGFLHGFLALLGLIGNEPARFFAALGRIEGGGRGADDGAGQEPGQRVAAFVVSFVRFVVRLGHSIGLLGSAYSRRLTHHSAISWRHGARTRP